ncbi:MAG: radical SAM protein [Calditrichaeota bacterium]|nr:MAG: radical SAM protein [Calditrichota bacterium]
MSRINPDRLISGNIPLAEPCVQEPLQISPDYVRISSASAIALRLISGRFARRFEFGGINILLNYEQGCFSDCAYCGLARTRPGRYEEKSFIRVDWPLVETDLLVERMAEYQDRLTRLCISMVTHGHAYRDTADITERIRKKVKTPLSILVAPPTLNYDRLKTFKALGVDMIGVGLDAVTEEVFVQRRTNVPQGGLKWQNYWDVIHWSREIFGPWKVNCHTLVGLGESDKDLIDLFYYLKSRQIFAYLFCFNPEPDSRMGEHPKPHITRWRRIQLVKSLLEDYDLPRDRLEFDEAGNLIRLKAPLSQVMQVVRTGLPFMTNGCPGENGEPGCTRPYGSYRPSEPYRDYPFVPNDEDQKEIVEQLQLEEFIGE